MLALVAGCGTSTDPYRYAGPSAPPSLDALAPANAEDIAKALTGNTLVTTHQDGQRWVRYIKPGGYVTGYTFAKTPPTRGRQWIFMRGVWRVDAGRLCLRDEDLRQENCAKVTIAPGVLHAYSEKDDSWRFSAEVRPGNPFGL